MRYSVTRRCQGEPFAADVLIKGGGPFEPTFALAPNSGVRADIPEPPLWAIATIAGTFIRAARLAAIPLAADRER